MVYYVYLIKTLNGYLNKSYVGYTNNLIERLKKHNSGLGAKSTKGYKWELVYKKKFYSKHKALSFEYKLKKVKKNFIQNTKRFHLNINLKKIEKRD